ncbi:MFS general substrate transporter [Ganoderma sinense ZZ0214-1]|uniref:MFS general substrate transporter n=1 Tax=Ganoderma sinense ZZ0214-1 TaxID=1077348 RepID=A0A2G8RWF7_9APHY|nr:MFS general substrate transporter [Ganoderma sinense ZZ0214-1]
MPGSAPAARASLESPRTSESLQKRRTLELVDEPGSIASTRVSTEASEKAEDVTYENSFPEGGRGWVVVLGCFILLMEGYFYFPWGYEPDTYSLVWGVTEEFFKEHMFPDTPDSVLTTLGSMSCLIMTLGGIAAGKLADRYGYKPFLAAGAVIWVASMLAAAFCTEIWQFFLTMGVMQGISDALVFPLIVALPSQWFLRRRAFATGIVVAGSSIGGAIASLVYRQLLSTLGLRRALAIFTAIDALAFLCGYAMLEERRPAEKRPPLVWFDRAFFADPVFWSLAMCFFFTVFGYLGPIFLLPTFTEEKAAVGTSAIMLALPVTVLNISAAVGRIFIGFAADKFGPVNALFVAIALSGLTQLVVWMFVTTYAGIMVFAILYGFFCGCFLSLMSAVAAKVYGVERLAGLSGLLLLFNAPGYAAGAPVGGAILGATRNNWQVVAGYSGAVQVLGALCLVYARLKREPNLFAAY